MMRKISKIILAVLLVFLVGCSLSKTAQVPHNLILKYSKADQTVLECFCGSGTNKEESEV